VRRRAVDSAHAVGAWVRVTWPNPFGLEERRDGNNVR
jgi:hypothetical protein